jgi:hypothetical protein
MSIFHADAAFALELIALSLGVFLVVWFRIHKEQDKMCRFFAYLIIALAILALLCTSYYSIKYWVLGYFEQPRAMMMQGKMKSSQMPQMTNRYKMRQMQDQMQNDQMPMMNDRMQNQMKDRQHMMQQQNNKQQHMQDHMMQPNDMQTQMPMHKKGQRMPMQ